MPRTPQIIVTLSPDGALAAEAPGPSGARRRVPLGTTGDSIAMALLADLLAQRDRARLDEAEVERKAQVRDAERREAEARERHRYIWDMAVRRHGPDFAAKTIGDRRAKRASAEPKATSTTRSAEALGL